MENVLAEVLALPGSSPSPFRDIFSVEIRVGSHCARSSHYPTNLETGFPRDRTILAYLSSDQNPRAVIDRTASQHAAQDNAVQRLFVPARCIHKLLIGADSVGVEYGASGAQGQSRGSGLIEQMLDTMCLNISPEMAFTLCLRPS